MTILRAIPAQSADVRVFEARPVALAVAEPDPIEQLESEVAALKESLASLRASQERKLLEAREGGRLEGLQAAEVDFTTRSASLAEAAQQAAATLDDRLDEWDGLAALIAEAALAQLFADQPAQAELVLAAIRRQVVALRRETVLGIHVSAEDFADADALAAAAAACGDHPLVADPDLPAGGCLIKLALGELDLSLPAQWQTLSALLHQLAREDAAS